MSTLYGQPPAFPFPRKKHSHRCPKCGNAVYCYRTRCQKPQRVQCDNCDWQERQRGANHLDASGQWVRVESLR